VKLAEIQTGPVQKVEGFEGLRGALAQKGEEQDRAWKQGTNLALNIENVAVDRHLTVVRQQEKDAQAAAKIGQAKLANDLDQKKFWTGKELSEKFGGWDNVPDTVKKQFNEDSTDIPGFAVNGDIYAKESQDIVDKASEKIGTPAFRDQFKQNAGNEAKANTEQIRGALTKESDDYEVAKMLNRVDAYANQGMFDEAKKEIDDDRILHPAQKEKAYQRLQVQKGEYGMQRPLRGYDRTLIQSTIAGLESGDNTFEVVDSSGKKSTIDVSAIGPDQRREKTRLLRNWDESIASAAKKQQDDQYKANDRGLLTSLLGADDRGLGAMLEIRRQAYEHPESFSPGMLKYMHSVIEAKRNQNFQRSQAYGQTDGNVAWVQLNTLMSKGGGNFIGPDGKDWGDVHQADLAAIGAAYGIKVDRMSGLVNNQARINKDQPPDNAWLTKEINRSLLSSGVTEDDDSKEAQARRADLTIGVTRLVDQEQARRKAAGESPMKLAEQQQMVQRFFEDPGANATIKDGKHWYGTDNYVPAPGISGLSTGEVKEFANLRGALLQQTGEEPFAPTGAAMSEFAYRTKKVESELRRDDTLMKTRPSASRVRSLAASITAATPKISGQLQQELGREPKTSEVIQRWKEINGLAVKPLCPTKRSTRPRHPRKRRKWMADRSLWSRLVRRTLVLLRLAQRSPTQLRLPL